MRAGFIEIPQVPPYMHSTKTINPIAKGANPILFVVVVDIEYVELSEVRHMARP